MQLAYIISLLTAYRNQTLCWWWIGEPDRNQHQIPGPRQIPSNWNKTSTDFSRKKDSALGFLSKTWLFAYWKMVLYTTSNLFISLWKLMKLLKIQSKGQGLYQKEVTLNGTPLFTAEMSAAMHDHCCSSQVDMVLLETMASTNINVWNAVLNVSMSRHQIQETSSILVQNSDSFVYVMK